MIQRECQGIMSLEAILRQIKTKRIFLVHGKSSFEKSGAKELLKPFLVDLAVVEYSNFTENPKLEDVERGVAEFKKSAADTIIAVGGGSTIDVAKQIKALAAQKSDQPLADYVKDQTLLQIANTPLIAIPTTTGTGSEATHFAVIYINKVKYSLAADWLLPNYVILEPRLVYELPMAIVATAGMDALCQAIESYWNIKSTDESKEYAKKAIVIILKNLELAYNGNIVARSQMQIAANLAGKAINITQTTACHAISYPLTSYFNVPHGQAVAITLGEMLIYNSEITLDDCADQRGIIYVKKIMKELVGLLGAQDFIKGAQAIYDLMANIGLAITLPALGIKSEEDRDKLLKNGFNPNRVRNNPRVLTEASLKKIFANLSSN